MAVITEAAVRELAGFRGQDAPVTSCYLDVDGRRLSRPGDCEHELERVLRSARIQGERHDLGGPRPPAHRGVRARRHRPLHHARPGHLLLLGPRLLAGGAAAGAGAQPGGHQRGAGGEPARVGDPGVRPLRACCWPTASGPASWCSTSASWSTTPSCSTSGLATTTATATSTGATWPPASDAQAAAHLRRAADVAFAMFQAEPFEHLTLGGPEPVVRALEATLHPYLRDRLCGRIAVGRVRRHGRDPRGRARRRARGRAPARGRGGRPAAPGGGLGPAGRGRAGPTVLAAVGEHRVDRLLVSAGLRRGRAGAATAAATWVWSGGSARGAAAS